MNIRQATEADLPACIAMAARFYAGTSYAEFAEFCPASVERMGRMILDTGVMLVAEADGGLVGMVGVLVAPFMFNASITTAHEVMWWVDPESQGAGVGAALLAGVIGACRARGATALQMVTLATSPPQAAALYARAGFTLSETSFTRTL